MNKLLCLAAVFSAGAWAQGPDFFQAPGATPVREFNSIPFVGGTYLGVNLAEIDTNRAKELKLKEDYGVEISRVEENSPAEKAGLKPGDVVQEYNGQRVEGMEEFGRLVRETPPGREVKLKISRNGATETLTAVLGSRKYRFGANFPPGFQIPEFHMPDIPQIFTTLRSPMLGVEAESLGSQLAVYFGVKEGVLVRSVLDNTPAEKAGIKAGDVITKVDGMMVTAPSELSGAVRNASGKKTYSIELVRDHKPVTVSVNVEDRSGQYIPRARSVQNSFTN
ncbi:MAG: PDZ domain-containing protein [Bryobacteraceae bacterium]